MVYGALNQGTGERRAEIELRMAEHCESLRCRGMKPRSDKDGWASPGVDHPV